MSGTLVGLSNVQQNDTNGKPLSNCLLTIFAGGTTTPSLVYQDIGLTLAAPNPLVGDLSGRIPSFFLADGIYHVRLTDQFGVMSNGGFDIPQIPSIGASTSGGGGSAVDPTTIAATGDVKWRLEDATVTGWVRINGRTIGSASSGASERANADTQALFIYIWNTYSQPSANVVCPVVGGIGASGLADFNANKQITLLDARDRAFIGLDTMGNTALGGLTGVPFTAGNSAAPGSSGGEARHILTAAQIPSINSLNNASPSYSLSSGATAGNVDLGVAGLTTPGGGFPFNGVASVGSATVSGFITITANTLSSISSNTGGQTHNNTPLFLLATAFWKL